MGNAVSGTVAPLVRSVDPCFSQLPPFVLRTQCCQPPHAGSSQPKPSWLVSYDGKKNVAICGSSGAGKSTLINTLRGIKPTDPGAAAVGVVETTLGTPKCYEYKQYMLWDLPGANTVKIPKDQYIVQYGLKDMDAVIIVAAGRSVEVELEIMQWLNAFNVPWIYVRSKLDTDIRNNKEDFGFTPQQTIEAIQKDMKQNFNQLHNCPQLFVISSRDKSLLVIGNHLNVR